MDKEKALDYLHHSAPIAEALSNPELDSAANIVRDFRNPKLPEENNPFFRVTMFRVTPEQDSEYKKAYEEGDTEKAAQMVKDAFKAMYPNTKVVDEKGEPLIVYHGTHYRFTKFSLLANSLTVSFGLPIGKVMQNFMLARTHRESLTS